MRQVGNIKSNQMYNPDEVRNPPPTNMIDAERDSELEKFIRGRSRSLSSKAKLTRAMYDTNRQVRVQTLRRSSKDWPDRHQPTRSICGCRCSSWSFPVCLIRQIFSIAIVILEFIAVSDTTANQAFSYTCYLGASCTSSCTDIANKCACRHLHDSLSVPASTTSNPVTPTAASCDWRLVRPCFITGFYWNVYFTIAISVAYIILFPTRPEFELPLQH